MEIGYDSHEAMAFSEKSIRRGFVRKVFGILMVQLAITVCIIAIFLFAPGVSEYSSSHPEMWWIAFSLTIVLIIVLSCCHEVRRKAPMNLIFLGIFTICEGFMLGSVASLYSADEVMIAAGICAAVCLGLTIFAMQTKWDFTACGGVICSMLVILIIFGILAICIPSRTLSMVYASLGAAIFSIYLVFDIQMIMGGKHKYAISPAEYIFAALNLYLDIINIFMYILAIIGNR